MFVYSAGASDIKITEVYFDGTDEWIELYNAGTSDFSGYISLSGLGSSMTGLDLSIGVGGVAIIGDSLTDLDITGLVSRGVYIHTGSSIGLTDTSAISITATDLLTSMTDSFVVSSAVVNALNNTRSSLHLILDGLDIITGADVTTTTGVIGTIYANPGYIYASLPMGTGDSNTGSSGSTDNTGNILYSLNTGDIYILELNPQGSTCLDEYMILQSDISRSGSIKILGAGSASASIEINISVNTGDRILISDVGRSGDIGFTGSHIITPLTLTNGGEPLQILYSGLVLDSVSYATPAGASSIYSSDLISKWSMSGLVRVFNQSMTSSVSSTCISAGDYNSSSSSTIVTSTKYYNSFQCDIDIQNKTAFYYGDDVNLVAMVNAKDISNANTSYTCQWDMGGGIYIYDCNPQSRKLLYTGINNIKLSIRDKYGYYNCDTSVDINYPLKQGNGLDNTDLAKILYQMQFGEDIDTSEDIYTGSSGLIYNTGIDTSTGPIISGDTSNSNRSPNTYITTGMRIYSITPDPVGADTSGEHISITVSSGRTLTGYILIGTKKILLQNLSGKDSPVIYSGYMLYNLTGNMSMKNSSGCVLLFTPDHRISDYICYLRPKAGQIITHSGVIDIVTGSISKTSKSPKINQNISHIYNSSGDIYGLIQQIAKLQLDMEDYRDKYNNLNDRYQERLDNQKLRYEDQIDKLKLQNANIKDEYKCYRDMCSYNNRVLSYRLNLQKNYNSYIHSRLKSEWKLARENGPLPHISSIVSERDRAIRSGNFMTYAGDQVVRSYEIKKLIKNIYEPNMHSNIGYIYDIIGTNISQDFGDNINKQAEYILNAKLYPKNEALRQNPQLCKVIAKQGSKNVKKLTAQNKLRDAKRLEVQTQKTEKTKISQELKKLNTQKNSKTKNNNIYTKAKVVYNKLKTNIYTGNITNADIQKAIDQQMRSGDRI